jgi:beta-N-acetylhexosaminidase
LTAGDPALERLADAILIPPFPGTRAPGWVLSALSRGLAGVTLYAENMAAGADSLWSLTEVLRSQAPDALIATDEEGGDVTRVWYSAGSPYPGNAALGEVDDTGLTEEVHAAMGADLAALGINLDLAPCLDVLAAPSNPVIGTRSFGSDPALVARHGRAAVRGLQSAGIAACAKHFPGHGSTLLDSHAELAVVRSGPDELDARDLPPFRAAVDAGVMTVMPGHLLVPGVTGGLPASLSAAAISLLRDLGFAGPIVSDALEMSAVRDPFGIPGAAVRAVTAGTDLLCLGKDVDEEGYLAVRFALCDAVRSGDLPAGRLEEAAARVAALRASLAGYGAGQAARETAAPVAAGAPRASGSSAVRPAAGSGTADGVGLRGARRALRLIGPRPELRDPVVAEVEPLLNMAAGYAHWGLADWVPPENLHRVPAQPPDPRSAAAVTLKAAAGRSLVLVVRDAHRSPATQDLVSLVLAERPDTVLVEMGLPYWRPVSGTYQAYVATYGASRANAEAAAELLGLAPHGPAAPPRLGG